ncbi:DUF4177 domain-containing protein [Pseudooctadecabacter sp.]|uniref:DUF4177 domain-containing protein n=1 Tax=Pseudooctadecabacter sp. TaxID=1966338 RepID=UPI0035C7BADC
MTGYEYKVVPAPTRPLKAKGVKGTPARFANALETVMNDLGTDGWEYQRTDTLPVEERQGLTGKTTTFQNMLVFRRALGAAAAPQVAALIEDQSAPDDLSAPPQVAAQDVAEDTEAMVEAEAEVAPAVNEADSADAPDEAESADERVDATLKSEAFTFPWNKRDKSNGRADDTQPAAE